MEYKRKWYIDSDKKLHSYIVKWRLKKKSREKSYNYIVLAQAIE